MTAQSSSTFTWAPCDLGWCGDGLCEWGELCGNCAHGGPSYCSADCGRCEQMPR